MKNKIATGIQFDKEHFKRLDQYSSEIDEIFKSATNEAVQIVSLIGKIDDSRPFYFKNYPQTTARIENLLNRLYSGLSSVVYTAVKKEWEQSALKNDALVDKFLSRTNLSKYQLSKFYNRNLEALEAFQERKINGLGLSDRIWKYTSQFKQNLEMGIDLSLGEGMSASELSRELRGYLKDPDNLFRRVRDKRGVLHLSKRARDFSPGTGVYRSSYKNAQRLARTEVNMAYRMSDHHRYQQLDFVVGIEIKLSNNHTLNGVRFTDICDDLKGRYPKTFLFTGWHPQCRCISVPILMTSEEFMRQQNEILSGRNSRIKSVNEVKDIPDNFKQWMKNNKERLDKAIEKGKLPYFIKMNKIKLIG